MPSKPNLLNDPLKNSISSHSSFLKAQGKRILSELNDLKRTIEACALELQWEKNEVEKIVSGAAHPEQVSHFIEAMVAYYPINPSSLVLAQDDCTLGIKVMRASSSLESARIFARRNSEGIQTPYYEYRDTAMSRLSAFRPEWIRELRIVKDNNPLNPDVIYNNGHFMHQVTFFVGPINFYYDIDGKKYCLEMNTGDSNYITPYRPHSFCSRNENEETYIIAVTFGGEVKRALEELYHLGSERAHEFKINMQVMHKGIQDLLDYHLKNELLNRSLLQQKLLDSGKDTHVLNRNEILSIQDIHTIANILNIEPNELMLSSYCEDEEIIVNYKKNIHAYDYPSASQAHYKIYSGVRCRRLPLLKTFEIKIVTSQIFAPDIKNSLHTYIYNHTKTSIILCWIWQNNTYEEIIEAGDSIYIQPFVTYGFRTQSLNNNASLFVVGIPGAINTITQRELSSFTSFKRVMEESMCWFTA
ncbi:MAG: hypothetical protein V4525_00540 [Pseudomonadota bacterium]